MNGFLVVTLLCATAAWLAVPATSGRAARGGWLVVAGVGAAAFAPFVTLRATHVALLVIAALALWGAFAIWRQRREHTSATKRRREVSEACSLLADEVRAGTEPGEALRRVADEVPVLAPVAQTHRLGGSTADAFRAAARHPGAADLDLVAAGWEVAARTGASLADSLLQVSAALRAAEASSRVIEGELASARATAKLVAFLPVVAWTMGAGAGGDPWQFLVGSPWGLACLAGGLALTGLGIWWIESLCVQER